MPSLDLHVIRQEFASTSKLIKELESELKKRKNISFALAGLIRALGGDPEAGVADSDAESESVPKTLQLGLAVTLPEVIKEAIPASGVQFGIDSIFLDVRRRFPNVKRSDIANVLWRLAKDNFLEAVQKGKRGTPARYVRI